VVALLEIEIAGTGFIITLIGFEGNAQAPVLTVYIPSP
jgi:hypothetical protein